MATLVEAIQRYCRLNPRAADTVDGVRAWLPAELRLVPNGELEAALEELVAGGSLTRRSLLDGSVVYFGTPPPGAR